jgi:two-component system sensor histidine kinase KdpD
VSAGIKVIGSINIQYVEELREQAEALTGKHVIETVPTSFITSADEIEIVDTPAEEPVDRSPEQQMGADRRQQQLAMLREMTLVLAADVVDHQLSDYLEKHGIKQSYGTQERILVCITPRAHVNEMIETAQKIAERFHGELIVAYIKQADLSATDNAELEERLGIARSARAQIVTLDGDDLVSALLDFAKARGITQLFVGNSQRRRKWPWSDPLDRLIRRSQGMDLRIFPQ